MLTYLITYLSTEPGRFTVCRKFVGYTICSVSEWLIL